MNAFQRDRPSWREVVVCAAAFAVVALVIAASHISHGGFYFDDWGVLSLVHYPPHAHSSTLHTLWQYYSKRPGEVLYYWFLDGVLGYSRQAQLALAAVALSLEVTCLFALLRRIGLARVHAAAIGLLILLFPFNDSLWLWAIMSLATVSSAVYVVGILLALRAFDRDSRALHALSLALYGVGILSYEVFGVLGCFVGLLYVREVGWQRARVRWALDVGVIVGSLAFAKVVLPDDLATPIRTQALSGMLNHAEIVVRQGARIVAQSAVPFGSLDYRVIVASLMALVVVALYARVLLPRIDIAREELGRWLGWVGVGLLIVLASWAIYVPAINYYSPGAGGTGNRVNALAAIGIVILLYACAALAVVLVRKLVLRRAQVPAVYVIAVLVVTGGAGYVHRLRDDSRTWNAAAGDQRALLDVVAGLVPAPPYRSTIFTFDHRLTVSAWVPVFGYPWDLGGALRERYNDRTINGTPVNPGTRWVCGEKRMYPTNDGYGPGEGGAYGRAYFVDVGRRESVAVRSRAQCVSVTAELSQRRALS